eukprot:5486712-Pleurochrysis_carterae.AAC.1
MFIGSLNLINGRRGSERQGNGAEEVKGKGTARGEGQRKRKGGGNRTAEGSGWADGAPEIAVAPGRATGLREPKGDEWLQKRNALTSASPYSTALSGGRSSKAAAWAEEEPKSDCDMDAKAESQAHALSGARSRRTLARAHSHKTAHARAWLRACCVSERACSTRERA